MTTSCPLILPNKQNMLYFVCPSPSLKDQVQMSILKNLNSPRQAAFSSFLPSFFPLPSFTLVLFTRCYTDCWRSCLPHELKEHWYSSRASRAHPSDCPLADSQRTFVELSRQLFSFLTSSKCTWKAIKLHLF